MRQARSRHQPGGEGGGEDRDEGEGEACGGRRDGCALRDRRGEAEAGENGEDHGETEADEGDEDGVRPPCLHGSSRNP